MGAMAGPSKQHDQIIQKYGQRTPCGDGILQDAEGSGAICGNNF
jgi:hypothetical protein